TTCPPLKLAVGEMHTQERCTSRRIHYDNACEVSCSIGYNLTSTDGVHTCTDKGTWSNDVTCELVKCAALAENKGEMYDNDTCTTDTKVYNDTCTMYCTLGYNLTSIDDVRMCTEDGTWSNNVTCELNQCPEVNDTVQARLVTGAAPFLPDSNLLYVCNTGYELADGQLKLWCRKDGQWSGKPPNCTVIKCPPLMSPNHTEIERGDASMNQFNTTIVYRCADGHDLMYGDMSRTCQSSKTWSGTAPTCRVVSCGPPAPVANAHASMTGDVYLANITYECKPGFKEVSGDWTRQCQADKRWSGEPPLCGEIRCHAPPVVANTTVTTDGVRVNDTATYSCLTGYSLRAGNLIKVCHENATWQNEDPECIEVHCGPAVELAQTNFSIHGGDKVGGKVTYTCIHGYERQSGSGFSRCLLSGEWTRPTLVCEEVTCGMPSPVKDAVMTPNCLRRDCVADYRCDVGYVGEAQQSKCKVDGEWTPVSLSCTRVSCGNVVTGTGAIVTDQTGDSYEATATIHCRRGYHRVTGSQLRMCIGDGTWSGTTLMCAATTCLTPITVNGAEVSFDDLTVDSNVTYRARDRYRHVSGDLVRTCREDQLWTGEQPVFEVKIFTDGIVVGSHATYSCVTGYELSAGVAMCECLISGSWSCAQPTCTPTGEKVSIFMPEDEEPKTEAERVMASMGIKKADKKTPNIAMGITGVVMMIIPVVLLVVSDFNILKEHFKMMLRNLKEGYQHFKQRNARVAPEPG
ncbi:Sushi, von Willebrand factor type A, EGF and pentraxin domain-containing protein 1, partial [Lamellibrachia satsuma]